MALTDADPPTPRPRWYWLGSAPASRVPVSSVWNASGVDMASSQLTDASAGLRRSGELRAVLSQVASSGITVLADPDARLKECERTGCTRIYLDRSRGARRSWCGMDECGNRVKAAAYRARRRTSSTA